MGIRTAAAEEYEVTDQRYHFRVRLPCHPNCPLLRCRSSCLRSHFHLHHHNPTQVLGILHQTALHLTFPSTRH